jgi:hypothetical protein
VGTGGYALNHYRQLVHAFLSYNARNHLQAVCSPYPGFDWDGGARIGSNIVCNKTLGRLGGRHVRERFAKDTCVALTYLEGGIAIVAGEAPAIGDGTRSDDLAPYRRVAHVLRAVRIGGISGLDGHYAKGAFTTAWLNALEDPASLCAHRTGGFPPYPGARIREVVFARSA